jgi:thymidylate kinase
MIVEFIGCSGAGKTTVAHMVRDRGGASPAVMALELVMDRPGRRWIRQPQLVNLVADATVLPAFLSAGPGELLRFADRRLRRYAPSAFARVNYLVNVERRVGAQLLALRRGNGATILSDEGALLLASQLFVYADGPYERADLERFVALVPLPDRVVYVRAPLEELVDRSMRRADRRRELAAVGRAEVERWTVRNHELFEALAAVPPVAERLLVVDDGAAGEGEALVDRIVAFIGEPAPVGSG